MCKVAPCVPAAARGGPQRSPAAAAALAHCLLLPLDVTKAELGRDRRRLGSALSCGGTAALSPTTPCWRLQIEWLSVTDTGCQVGGYGPTVPFHPLDSAALGAASQCSSFWAALSLSCHAVAWT